ncbi:MAG TPA: SRPBCC family protein [Allosphingosinicella sp.]|nr:SRPBCC family protein [Allosphingosinicella sp.]
MIWKWVAALFSVPVGLAAIVYGVGALLPRDHVAAAAAVIPAATPEVAALVRDVEGQPRWRSAVDTIEVLERRSGGGLLYVERSGSDAIRFDFAEEERDVRFRSVIADPALPFGGAWTIALEPAGDGTRVSIEERGEVRDPLYRFFSRFVFGHEATMRTYLADLEQAVQHRRR